MENEIVPRIKLTQISKHFGGIKALDDISFSIMPGEVHALVGENGAGKSTLVKIITGLEKADVGSIELDGERIHFSSPMEAREFGVLAVYQDPKLFPNLDIAENIFMGIHPKNAMKMVDWQTMYKKTKSVLEWLGSDLDPRALVATLSIGEMQYVEFARAMFDGNERVLILDEPTSSLSPNEVEKLFHIINRIKAKGVSILFISHRLEELFGFADRVTILRDGTYVTTKKIEEISQEDIIKYMVGRSLKDLYGSAEMEGSIEAGEAILEVNHLTSEGEFYDISFTVRAGEIVGLSGLVGAGRTEVAKALFGNIPITSGEVFFEGKKIDIKQPSNMIDLGLVYIPEDREAEGLLSHLSVSDNLSLPSVKSFSSRIGIIRKKKEQQLYEKSKERFQIKSESGSTKVSSLSGGNRQKVVLAKWMPVNPRLIILDEPTHGIDVGSKAQVHQIMKELAMKGIGILMISSDLPEILRMSDRVLVMAGGNLISEFPIEEATQENIMKAATTHKRVLHE